MTREEVAAITETVQVALETAFIRMLDKPAVWTSPKRAEASRAIERAIRRGIEIGIEQCLVKPFPRRGSPRAILSNAKPLIRSAVEKELKTLIN